MDKAKIQVIFFGTPDFAVPSLEALNKAPFCDIKAVVTGADKPVGRHQSKPVPSPVKQASQRLKLPVFEGLDSLKELKADLGIVVAYGEILPKWLLDRFPLGIVNIHPSLLPKYRGSSPIQAAILNQDKETGVTLIKLDDKMDHGPIIAQETVGARHALSLQGMTAGQLHDELTKIGAQMLIKYLPDYIAGKIKLKPQDDSQATFTKKLTKEDGKIDWKKSPQEIEAHIRAMNPWPGAWTMWKGKRLIIWKASFVGARHALPLQLDIVQLEGKKRMPLKEFLKGHPDFAMDELGWRKDQGRASC